MKSRTSCSEMSLFRRCLQRYWPFWLGMAAVMVLFYVLPLANMLSDPSRPQVASGNLGPVQIFVYGHMDTGLLYALLFGLVAAMLVFEHTYSTKLTGLFASLPVKRSKLFRQHWLAGAVMLLSTGLLIALALLAVEAVYGAADLLSALTFLAVWSMESLTFYGIAAFCVMLTGHVLVIPALYLLLNFAGSALNLMLGGLVTSYAYGVMGGANGLDWLHTLSPVVRLMTECGQGFGPNGELAGFIGWGWVIGYFIVGLVFTALALWLFLRRQNERAQETTAFGVLRPILKYIVTIFFGLGFPFLVLYFLGGFSFYGSVAEGARFFPLHLILSLIGAVIGYFLSEMIIRKSFRAFSGKGWLKALLVGLLCCAVVALFRFDAFGIARYIPEVDEVEVLQLSVGSERFVLRDPEQIEAAEALQREIYERRGEIDGHDYDGGGVFLQYAYRLKDGKAPLRGYYLPKGPLLDLAQETLHGDVLGRMRIELTPPVPMDEKHVLSGEISYMGGGWLELTGAEALALYNEAILPDVQEGNYSQMSLAYDEQWQMEHCYMVSIDIAISADDGESAMMLQYQPTLDTVHTNAWLEAHGIPLVLEKDGVG
ncbi:MAG: hypothetical protein IJI27_01500 [Oscillospiraceae bacterium]|nr:hypothetical protein [Oscillospiraceae bacterium]